jgi:hypothetical protein
MASHPGSLANNTVPKDAKLLFEKLFPVMDRFWKDVNFTWGGELRSQIVIRRLRRDRMARLQETLGRRPIRNLVSAAIQISVKDAHALDVAFHLCGAPRELIERLPRDIAQVNKIIDIYCGGKIPDRYADIDSAKYSPNSIEFDRFIDLLREWQLSISIPKVDPLSFNDDVRGFTPCDAFDFAIELLIANERCDAIGFPDLWENENLGAVKLARRINWSEYKYTAIMIPGQGPEFPEVKISPLARLKTRMAVSEFNKKDNAPFLVVSGGNVYPAYTQYNEAIEMKKWLIDQLDIPAERIVVEPFARHTTTNFRNTARTMKLLDAPIEKEILVVSDREQIDFILNYMEQKVREELGHTLGRIEQGPMPLSVVYRPSEACGIVGSNDPMDP